MTNHVLHTKVRGMQNIRRVDALSYIINSDPYCWPFQANPDPSTCLGVFGLSLYTTERDLREVFSRYGPLAGVNVVYDQRTGRSRGFAFVYFERLEDSKEVWEMFYVWVRLSVSFSPGPRNSFVSCS